MPVKDRMQQLSRSVTSAGDVGQLDQETAYVRAGSVAEQKILEQRPPAVEEPGSAAGDTADGRSDRQGLRHFLSLPVEERMQCLGRSAEADGNGSAASATDAAAAAGGADAAEAAAGAEAAGAEAGGVAGEVGAAGAEAGAAGAEGAEVAAAAAVEPVGEPAAVAAAMEVEATKERADGRVEVVAAELPRQRPSGMEADLACLAEAEAKGRFDGHCLRLFLALPVEDRRRASAALVTGLEQVAWVTDACNLSAGERRARLKEVLWTERAAADSAASSFLKAWMGRSQAQQAQGEGHPLPQHDGNSAAS